MAKKRTAERRSSRTTREGNGAVPPQGEDLCLEDLDKGDLIRLVKGLLEGGVALSFHGRLTALEIAKRVRPRVMRRESRLHFGPKTHRSKNWLIEGENLQALTTLYRYRGEVDLILTDPPYNTGQNFRYNDRWDTDPNDPDLGTIVRLEDGARHTKWIKAMMPRLQLMHAMLKPGGVLAICIDENELFHLGMMLNEVFREENRLAIINWQKTTAKNNAKHVASATEYVLVYAKDRAFSATELLPRSEKADARFRNPDGDPRGDWKQGDLSGPGQETHFVATYAIQSPFTGQLHYPPDGRHWGYHVTTVKAHLEGWGVKYESRDIGDGRPPALVIKGAPVQGEDGYGPNDRTLKRATQRAKDKLSKGSWPQVYFGKTGLAKPMEKQFRSALKAGSVPTTFWVDEDDTPLDLGSVSWASAESGRSREGVEDLDKVVGRGHMFQTAKPVRLFRRLVSLWCPPSGLVLDPYAGSGTTAQAVLELNKETGADRRFILIEQGSPENGDKYARTLTRKRLVNVISGERPDGKATPTGSAFTYFRLTEAIDSKVVLSMKRDELIDIVVATHLDNDRAARTSLIRPEDDDDYQFFIGTDAAERGYFLIWNGDGPVRELNRTTYKQVLQEAKRAGLKPPYNVYARYEVYQTENVKFWKIPDKILAHLGIDVDADS